MQKLLAKIAGAILLAAGVGAVIVCDPVTDIFNPNVVRSSTGVLFSMPVVVAGSAEVRSWLHERGIRAIATTPAAPALYTDSDCADQSRSSWAASSTA